MSDPYGEAQYEPQYVQPGQPGWYDAPPPPHSPATPPRDEPPARKRRVHPAVLIVAAVVVAAAVVGLVVAFVVDGDTIDAPGTGGRRLAVPATIPGYRVVADVPTDDLKASVGEELAKQSDEDPDNVVRHAAVGVWTRPGDTNRVLFIGLALRDIPAIRDQVRSDGVQAALKFFLLGIGEHGSTVDVAPGPRGGFMRCTTATVSGEQAGVCGWGDESALALTMILGNVSRTETATVARELRSAIESA